jgi:hypothetical protein
MRWRWRWSAEVCGVCRWHPKELRTPRKTTSSESAQSYTFTVMQNALLDALWHLLTSLGIVDLKSLVTFLGEVGGFLLFLMAVSKYWKAQKWKRAEFLAKEMKEFFDTPRVKTALLLIDWGSRRLHLDDDEVFVLVDRQMQTMALRPHVLLDKTGSDAEVFSVDGGSGLDGFTGPETAIRDCYDAFLDGLERFSSYVTTGLIDVSDLRPYLGYWIDDISSLTENPEDAGWCAALLTYITFYRFDGVLSLFDAFGTSIRPSSSAYISFLKLMVDQDLAVDLAGTVNCTYSKTGQPTQPPRSAALL